MNDLNLYIVNYNKSDTSLYIFYQMHDIVISLVYGIHELINYKSIHRKEEYIIKQINYYSRSEIL